MGLFSGKKKTYVSSVVYNMAGDELDRPNYLKTTVINSILNGMPSIGDSITDSYLHGPGMRFRSFQKWANRTDYNDTVGLVTGSILTGDSIDMVVLAGELTPTPGWTIVLQSASTGDPDYSYWTDQYIAENYPNLLFTEYTSDFDLATNTITITWEDTTTTTFNPTGYDPLGLYLYVIYKEEQTDVVEPLVTGDSVTLDVGDDFPDTTGWTLISHDDDGLGTINDVYEKITYMGQDPVLDGTYTLKETMYQSTVPDDPDPPIRAYRIDTQVTFNVLRSPLKIFIYKKGDGNAVLDAMFNQKSEIQGFYPFIPFRIDNKFLSDTYLPDVYTQAKKGYKKATTGRYDDLVDELKDNDSIDDIDYAYTVFGVSLNVLENASRKYVYVFFKEILNDYGSGSYGSWQAEWDAAKESETTWAAWKTAQSTPGDPLYGTPEPTKLAYPPMPTNSIKISSGNNPVMNFDMTISWNSMIEETGVGLIKPDAHNDELWFTIGDTETFEELNWTNEGGTWRNLPTGSVDVDEIVLNWQVNENNWRKLRIKGLLHKNLVYKSKSVDITAKEALEDPDESGFIVPLHDGVYRSLGLVTGTQMATACSFMVFNCYQVVKQKWYQTTIFKIILVIIIIVIAYFTGGSSLGASSGVLGTNAAVGAAILGAGASLAAIAIVGAIANAIAAMLIMKIITTASVKIFGEKWGALIGAIASIIVLQVGTAMASGQTMSSAFSGLMRVDNLMKLTSAVGNSYANYLQSSTMNYIEQTQEVVKDYKEKSMEIQEAWLQNIGGNRGIIDPMTVTDVFGASMESINAFLQRTMMTGSDVAEMSLDMLTNFVNITLNTDLST